VQTPSLVGVSNGGTVSQTASHDTASSVLAAFLDTQASS
jgi:hypothetical protein